MHRSGKPVLERLRRLEVRLLSDDHLLLKQWMSWLALLGMIGYCGAGSEWVFSPGLFDYLQAPPRYEGAQVWAAYSPLMKYTHGPGYLFRSLFGWTPLREPYTPATDPGYPHSIYGIWHADGTVTALLDWPHPLRELKGEVSAVAAVALVLALLHRYVPRRRSSRPTTPAGGA
jgi:hypothetical protein